MRKKNNKMLAVRLQPELVDAVRDYAGTEHEGLSLVVEEFIRLGLARDANQTREKKPPIDAATRKMQLKQYWQAAEKGEVYRWAEKKMLAVRLPPELVDAVKDHAAKEEQNIVVIIEEFLRFGLEQKQGEVVVSRIPTIRFQMPYKKRRGHVNG